MATSFRYDGLQEFANFILLYGEEWLHSIAVCVAVNFLYYTFMTFTRRKFLLLVWALSIVGAGLLIAQASGNSDYGFAASLSLLAISLGVPLMRALTEFSK